MAANAKIVRAVELGKSFLLSVNSEFRIIRHKSSLREGDSHPVRSGNADFERLRLHMLSGGSISAEEFEVAFKKLLKEAEKMGFTYIKTVFPGQNLSVKRLTLDPAVAAGLEFLTDGRRLCVEFEEVVSPTHGAIERRLDSRTLDASALADIVRSVRPMENDEFAKIMMALFEQACGRGLKVFRTDGGNGYYYMIRAPECAAA